MTDSDTTATAIVEARGVVKRFGVLHREFD